ncbi:Protein polyglycylase TTLL10 [Hondaea fermentalgiana]|uniref:Protein polyglycylase TTLL10 n=1 Tax=Hondaea fermentalgiana TaxID=2315210 RepID=A0A2R5GSX8_9STRA|nr:Protein polyglycylase TTLL10 [Hondaea fermentalgiana]|eukprot:GBG32868.1 Protein polyglycylase TTLL10 [Hondaea fermentalgiana]
MYAVVGGLLAVWMFTIHRFEMNTIDMMDSVGSIGSTLIDRSGLRVGAGGGDGAAMNSVQFFILVGRKNCKYAALAEDLLDGLVEAYPTEVMKYKWTADSKREFDGWVSARKLEKQVPEYHTTSPVLFLRTGDSRKFLGGASQLIEYVRIRYPEYDLSEIIIRKVSLDDSRPSGKDATLGESKPPPRSGASNQQATELEYEDQDDPDAPLSGDGDSLPEDSEPPVDGDPDSPSFGENPEQSPVVVDSSQEAFLHSPYNKLEPQVLLRKKSIVTTYRVTEKRVTNYRPMIQFLRERGWSNIPMAPLLATWILVQDQKTAAYVLSRYHKAIVNNIGYGGQSCFGGTKGYQLRCRSDFASKFGCSYDDLNVQPPQYRLWEEPECRAFFDRVCPRDPDAMWIEKPSGGQHGAGMKVHQGCAKLSVSHSACSGTGKKYIAMPYLSPALLSGHKFDVRSYLLIASLDPLLVFYHDGFARKAANLYSSDVSDVDAHITNADSQNTTDHFYEFSRLEEQLHRESGFPSDYMRRVFREHAIKVQRYVFHASRQTMKLRKKGVYQIFALDWIIDDDGGIHMLEANSNPLVTVYKDMATEFTETWDSMVDLVLKVQTAPATLFSKEYPELVTTPAAKRFKYRGWELMFSELEERHNQDSFNPCSITITPFSVKAERKALQGSSPTTAKRSTSSTTKSVSATSTTSASSSSSSSASSSTSSGASLTPRSTSDASNTAQTAPDTGPAETPYQISADEVRNAIKTGASRPCEHLEFKSGGGNGVFQDCVKIDRGLGPDDETTRCRLGDASYFYVIEPQVGEGKKRTQCYPIIMVVAGVHGNEHSGIVAAHFIRQKWTLQNARLVIVERLNERGVGKGRYIPKVAQAERDLNRNFPVAGPVGSLAKQIWSVVEVLKPHIFLDLHEGWGVYNRLKQNKGGRLVGNPSFSKGSSIISTQRAQPLAKYMINKVNELTVQDPTRHFLSIVPPIESGLASMIDRTFSSLVMVSETTSKGQPLYLRAQQQLIMVGSCLTLLGLVPKSFDPREGFDVSQACLAGSAECGLRYPNDEIVGAEVENAFAAAASDPVMISPAVEAAQEPEGDADDVAAQGDEAQYGKGDADEVSTAEDPSEEVPLLSAESDSIPSKDSGIEGLETDTDIELELDDVEGNP